MYSIYTHIYYIHTYTHMCIYVYYTFILVYIYPPKWIQCTAVDTPGDESKTPNTANNSPGMLGS